MPDVRKKHRVSANQTGRGRAVPNAPRRRSWRLVRRRGREQALLDLIPRTGQENPFDLLGTAVAAAEVLQARDPQVPRASQRQAEGKTAEADPGEPLRSRTKLPTQRPEVASRAAGTENEAKRPRAEDKICSPMSILEDRANAELPKRRRRDGGRVKRTIDVWLVQISGRSP